MFAGLAVWGLTVGLLAAAPVGTRVGETGFEKYTANGGKLIFYLSSAAGGESLPLVVFVPGTGCGSAFVEGNGRILSGLQSLLLEASRGRARVMVVEKPGVQYLDAAAEAGNSRKCREEFVREYTLEKWAGQIAEAMRIARGMAGVERRRMLVVGHSEGALVAMRVSNLERGVTHVAALSGGGPTYLFHMAEFLRKKGLDPERELYPCWNEIRKDPASTTKFCWGQTHRQWWSFMKTSIVAEALRSRSALYFGHGTGDELNPISAFDVLRAELAAKGRSAVFDRVEGAGHGFERRGEDAPAGLLAVFGRIFGWFAGAE